MLLNIVIKEKEYFQWGGGEKLVFGGRGDKLVFEIREMPGLPTQNETLDCVWSPQLLLLFWLAEVASTSIY